MINILYIGDNDFVRVRGEAGSTQDLDLITYLHTKTNKIDGFSSLLIFSNEYNIDILNTFKPTIVYIYDCNIPYHMGHIINDCNNKHIPIVLIANDIFYVSMISNEPKIKQLQGIVSMIDMSKIMDQYRNIFPDKYISQISTPLINTEIFNNYNLDKKYDIVIYGIYDLDVDSEHLPFNVYNEDYIKQWKVRNQTDILPSKINFYEFRKRLVDLILSNKDKYKVRHITTPPRACWSCPVRGKELSKILNQSYMCIATRTMTNRCMQKYFEIAASDCCILGNIPTDYKDLFQDNIIEVTDEMTDEEILSIFDKALIDKQTLLNKTREFGRYIRENHGMENKNTIKSIIETSYHIVNK